MVSLAKRAIFLDRDGTLNEDPGYLSNPDHLKLLPGVAAALYAFKHMGFELIVVSNQSGVGRGFIPASQIPLIHERLNALIFKQGGAPIDQFELCFHKPEDNCACRKPCPKLISDAAIKYSIDTELSYMIGDKVSDVECGARAGCLGSLLVRTGEGKNQEASLKPNQASAVVDSLAHAVQWIRSQETSNFEMLKD